MAQCVEFLENVKFVKECLMEPLDLSTVTRVYR